MASETRKVVVHLRATGDAPILKQAKFKIGGDEKFMKVIDFLRRQLHRETLFVYVNSAFSPNPDELVSDLYSARKTQWYLQCVEAILMMAEIMYDSKTRNFGFDGKLVVNYACSMAWG